jgi:glycosyltransferase involved in cell wall biosynthesis
MARRGGLVRILFVNHTSSWSGAEVALMRLVDDLRGSHGLAVACPAPGPLTAAVDAAGVVHFRIPATELSLRMHPTRTALGLAQAATAAVVVRAAARRHGADVIHANTLRAGLVCGLAARLRSPPVLVQVHEHLPPSRLARAARHAVARSSSAVVAVTDRTAAQFNQGLAAPVAGRVYVSVDLKRFDPERVPPADVHGELGLPHDAVLIGHLAQITPWKGQDTAIRMVAGVAATRPDVHLVLVGAVAFKNTRYDNEGYLASLQTLVDELELRSRVHFLGQRTDVPALLRAFTMTVLPSWDEPFGLAALESMAMGTPPLVTAVGGAGEYLADGVAGRLLDPNRPELWTAAALELLADRARLRLMADEGRRIAAGFSNARYAQEMLEAYRAAIRAAQGTEA